MFYFFIFFKIFSWELIPPFSIPSGDLIPSDDVADLVPSKVGASFAEVSDLVSSDAAAADLFPPEERAFSIPSEDLVHLREVSDLVPSDDIVDLVPSKVGASLVPTEDLISIVEVSDLVFKSVHIYISMIILRNR